PHEIGRNVWLPAPRLFDRRSPPGYVIVRHDFAWTALPRSGKRLPAIGLAGAGRAPRCSMTGDRRMTAMRSGLGLTRLRSISGFAPAVTFGGERRETARVCNGLGRFLSPDAPR